MTGYARFKMLLLFKLRQRRARLVVTFWCALLTRHEVEAYLSTVHLGRTLKWFERLEVLGLAPAELRSPGAQMDEHRSADARRPEVVERDDPPTTTGAHPSWAGEHEPADRSESTSAESSSHDAAVETRPGDDVGSLEPPPQDIGIVVDEVVSHAVERPQDTPPARNTTSSSEAGIPADELDRAAAMASEDGGKSCSQPSDDDAVTDAPHASDIAQESVMFPSEIGSVFDTEVFEDAASNSGEAASHLVPPAELQADAGRVKPVKEADSEYEAINQILSRREAQDSAVREASARATATLPASQQACVQELKEFAFGGGDGLTEEDVSALGTVAICGDVDGLMLAFLRHSKFDVGKAKESIRRCCAWRRETQVLVYCSSQNAAVVELAL